MVGLLALSVVDHGFISGVMVGLLALSVVDHGFKVGSNQITKLVFVITPLSTQQKGVRAGWLRIMCQSRVTCLPTDLLFQ
jgi:hypothetical protein